MKIHAHIVAWNEEMILPYTLDHYSQFCEKIFVYDNMSTDSSDKIYKKYDNVEVIKWSSNNEINEMNYVNLKSMSYRIKSRDADWVIVCDCDELLYHENLIEKLEEYKKQGITVPRIDGHDMVCETFPKYDGSLLVEKVKIGSQTYEPMCKNIIFDPKLDVSFGIGAHTFSSNNTKYSEFPELKLLHYKFLGKDYVRKLYMMRAKRLSTWNKERKLGEHYFNLPFDYMDKMLSENYQVI